MQSGPGTENAFGGVAQAYGESAPILVLPMGYSRRAMHVAPNFNAVANFQHVTKWCEPLSMGKAMPEVMRRAFTQLRSGRPGPVMVEVPADVFGEDVPDDLGPRPSGTVRVGPDPELIRDAAAMLAAAERPVIYAGQGRPLRRGLGRAATPGRTAQRSGDDQPRRQELVQRRPSPVARVRWPRGAEDGA